MHPKVNPVHHRNPVPKHGVWLGQDYRMSRIDGLDAVTQQLAKKIIFLLAAIMNVPRCCCTPCVELYPEYAVLVAQIVCPCYDGLEFSQF